MTINLYSKYKTLIQFFLNQSVSIWKLYKIVWLLINKIKYCNNNFKENLYDFGYWLSVYKHNFWSQYSFLIFLLLLYSSHKETNLKLSNCGLRLLLKPPILLHWYINIIWYISILIADTITRLYITKYSQQYIQIYLNNLQEIVIVYWFNRFYFVVF